MKMRSRKTGSTIRKIVSLPRWLLDEAVSLAPTGLARNWNQLVCVALEQFIARRKRVRFAEDMARMAHDPQAMADERRISHEFSVADGIQ